MLTSALHERLSAIPPPVSPLLLQEKMLNAERKRKERLDKLVMREKAKVKRATRAQPQPTCGCANHAAAFQPRSRTRALRAAREPASPRQRCSTCCAVPHRTEPQLPQQSEVGKFIAPPPTARRGVVPPV